MENRLNQDPWAGPTQDRVRRQPCHFWVEGSRSPEAALTGGTWAPPLSNRQAPFLGPVSWALKEADEPQPLQGPHSSPSGCASWAQLQARSNQGTLTARPWEQAKHIFLS